MILFSSPSESFISLSISIFLYTSLNMSRSIIIQQYTLSFIYSSFLLGKCILIFVIFRSWICFLKLSGYKNKINYTFSSQKWKSKKEKNNNKKLEWLSEFDELLYSCLEPLRLLREAEDICSVQFSHSVVSKSLRPHGLQHAWLPCPSRTPRACSNSC